MEQFRSKRVLDRFQPARLIIKIAQIVPHEGDEPDAPTDLSDADAWAGEDVTEVHLTSLLEHIVLKGTQPGAETRFSLEDVLTALR